MRRSIYAVLTVLGLSIIALSLAMAQGQGQGQGQGEGKRPGGRGGFGGFGGTPEERAQRMMEFRARMIDEMPITESEKAAAKDSAKAKSDARTKLQQKLDVLRQVTDDQNASEDQVRKALTDFTAAHAHYITTVASADGALVKKISMRTRARLTVMGFIENGVGGGGFGGFGGFGRGGRGGPGGRGPGGPGDFGKGKNRTRGGNGQIDT